MRSMFLLGCLAVAIVGITSGQASAKPICYEAPTAIIRLDVKFHSNLTTGNEKRKFGHPIQKIYSADGKLVDDDDGTTSIVSGTVVVAKGVGARMSLSAIDLFLTRGGSIVDCRTAEPSATPDHWFCLVLPFDELLSVTNEILPFDFDRVKPLDNQNCSIFELPPL